MMQSISLRAFLLVLLAVFMTPALFAQSDRDVKDKQQDLKKEYNEAQEKNQIIKSAADDKPRPTTGRQRRSYSTGYDYTQVKGFELKQFHERIDEMFDKANQLGLFEEEYRKDGTFDVAGRKGLGSAQVRAVEVYYAEATPEEQEENDLEPFHILEIRVQKLETLPPEEMGDEGEDESALMFGGGSGEPVAKAFSLSGADLWTLIQLTDEGLYDDILTKRNQSQSIPLPADLFLPDKVGPFIVMTERELETSASRFRDFWNSKDTLSSAVVVPQADAAGPLYTATVPVFYPEQDRISIRNSERDKQLKITNVTFVGENAADWVVKSKFPKVLQPKGQTDDKSNVEFEYVGGSAYEVRGQLFVEAQEANLTQTIDVYANPGRYPADVVTLDLSPDKLELRSPARSSFAPNWKLSYAIGSEVAGLPRWTSGVSSLSIGYKNEASVGIVLPMNMTTPGFPAPLGYDKGLLSSSEGYDARFDFTFGFPFSLGGYFMTTSDFGGEEAYQHLMTIKDRPEPGAEVEDFYDDFFHIGTLSQLYYPIMFKDRSTNPNMTFRLEIGGAFMRIMRDHLVNEEDIAAGGKGTMAFQPQDLGTMYTLERYKDYVDIYLRMGFINLNAKNRYGMGIQYFSGRMMADAFLELTSWLRVEAKYSFLLRDREVWENETTYFLISPRIRLGLPSLFN